MIFCKFLDLEYFRRKIFKFKSIQDLKMKLKNLTMVDITYENPRQNDVQLTSNKMTIKETHSSFLPSQDSELHCEHTALWKAVITQALMDAGSNSKKPAMKKAKAQAISWLNGNSDDFAEVCIMAGLDPQNVKEKAKEAIKRGCKWRVEPGLGKKSQQNKKTNIKANQAKDFEFEDESGGLSKINSSNIFFLGG